MQGGLEVLCSHNNQHFHPFRRSSAHLVFISIEGRVTNVLKNNMRPTMLFPLSRPDSFSSSANTMLERSAFDAPIKDMMENTKRSQDARE